MSTKFFDMRIKGQNACLWNEEFIFEILECNTSMIIAKDRRLNAELMYPIAWAYLRPLGKADIHLSRNRLQLYRSKFNYDDTVKQARPFDHRTPIAFMEFNWPRREKYPSYLEVDL